jgi:uncharacterized MAPEG superfamily protein
MTFTWAYGVVLAAFVLPWVCAGVAKVGRRDFDNRNPRAWEAQLHGVRARAVAAMHNSFEAAPLFASAVIVAHQLHAPQAQLDALALSWLALRLVYIALYLGDRSTLRSVVWVLASGVAVALFVLGA